MTRWESHFRNRYNFTGLQDPKDSLTREEVNAAAAKLIPILITRSGAEVTELEKATISTTTTEELA